MQVHTRFSLHARHAIRVSLFGLLLGTSESGIANPHHARAVETKHAVVSLEGLDLATAKGVSRAHLRVTAAVKRLCKSFSDSRKVDDNQLMIDCYHETLADALQRLDARLAAQSTTSSNMARIAP